MWSVRRAAAPTPLRSAVEALLLLYAGSVLSGGLAHHFSVPPPGSDYDAVSKASAAPLETPLFRTLWRICVGTVVAASWAQGAVAVRLAATFPSVFDELAGKSSSGQRLGSGPSSGGSAAAATGAFVRRVSFATGAAVGGCTGAVLGGLVGALLGAWPGSGIRAACAGLGGREGPGGGPAVVATFAGLLGGVGPGSAVGALLGRSGPGRAVALACHPWGEAFWAAWALAFLVLAWHGGLSNVDPAVDIFLAGATQV